MKCPKCSSQTVIKYGRARGRQRYKCKDCGSQFTVERPRARSLEEKLFAMSLLVSGLSMTGGKSVGSQRPKCYALEKFGSDYFGQSGQSSACSQSFTFRKGENY